MSEHQRCLDYLKEHPVARSQEMDEALDLTPGRAASLLQMDVKSGLLVMCKVINQRTGRECNEYRYSVSGGGAPVDLRNGHDRLFKPRADVQKPVQKVQNPAPPPAPAATADSSPLDDKWLADPRTRMRATPTERAAPPAQVDGELPRLGPIEKGVPIPPSKRPDKGELRAHLQKLEVGDSFETAYSQAGVHRHAKKLGIEVTYRPISKEKGKKRVRVWRTK